MARQVAERAARRAQGFQVAKKTGARQRLQPLATEMGQLGRPVEGFAWELPACFEHGGLTPASVVQSVAADYSEPEEHRQVALAVVAGASAAAAGPPGEVALTTSAATVAATAVATAVNRRAVRA